MKNKGHVRLLRKSWEHSLSPEVEKRKFTKFEAMFWLITKAAGIDGFKGNGLILKRGHFSFQQRYLAQRWRWSKTTVKRFLDHLVGINFMDQVLDQETDHGQVAYAIRNYDEFNPQVDQVLDQETDPIKKELLKKQLLKTSTPEFDEVSKACTDRGRELKCSLPTFTDLLSEYSLKTISLAAARACDWLNEKAAVSKAKTFHGPLRAQRLQKFLDGMPKKGDVPDKNYLN